MVHYRWIYKKEVLVADQAYSTLQWIGTSVNLAI
jgi:hypothetical protein